jgi:ankyrin repeat protein
MGNTCCSSIKYDAPYELTTQPNFNGSNTCHHKKHQFLTPLPAKKRCTQSFILEDAWSIIASFLPIKEQFSVLYISKRIQQTALNSVLQDTKNSMILFTESVLQGYNAITQFLLSHDLFDPSDDDNYAIKIASEHGRTEVVRLLLNDNRVDPSARNNNAITFASFHGNTEVVRLLLSDKRIDPFADDDNDAIRFTSENGHVEVVRLLLSDSRVEEAGKTKSTDSWQARARFTEQGDNK